MNYTTVKDFGSNMVSEVNNPLTYCVTPPGWSPSANLDQRFMHGSHSNILGPGSRPCQLFLSEYCSKGWDKYCEMSSQNSNVSFPNNMQTNTNCSAPGMTQGDMLIRNTAERKYLMQMVGGHQVFEPFDPTVPQSPMISSWQPLSCNMNGVGSLSMAPIYSVNPKTIDDDVVMDKILRRPMIAADILVNIYNTMKRLGTLSELSDTKLGKFYATEPFFKKN